MVPSKIASTKPWIPVIGVRKSCEILQRKVRREFSIFSREAAISLKESPIRSISETPVCGIRTVKSPPAKVSNFSLSKRIGLFKRSLMK